MGGVRRSSLFVTPAAAVDQFAIVRAREEPSNVFVRVMGVLPFACVGLTPGCRRSGGRI